MAMDVLKDLDERIQASVNRIQQLKHENEQLAERLAENDRKLLDAQAQIKQFEEELRQHETERDEVRGRIEKILARFDGIDLG